MSAAQAARGKERVAELARSPRVTTRSWGAVTAIGTAVVLAIVVGSMVSRQTGDVDLGSAPAQLQAPPTSQNAPSVAPSDDVVPAVSVASLPSVESPSSNRQAVPRAAVSAARPPTDQAGSTEHDDALSKELRLVDGARIELALNPQRAHGMLVRHASEFPSGQLASEREVLLVDVLLRLDRRHEAEAHARALTTREPGSPYAQRVDALLSSSASKPEKK
jgi:hypothetical protein